MPSTIESWNGDRGRGVEILVTASKLRYYIHDRVESCRLELLGGLTESEIPELQGCWRTVKTTVGNRKVVIDVRQLEASDDAGRKWLAAMRAEGAHVIEVSDVPDTLPKQRVSFLRRLFSAAPESSTQAQ